MIKVNDYVIIKQYENDEVNRKGRVTAITKFSHGIVKYHVSNLTMPFCGVVCDWFELHEIYTED